MLTEKLRKQPQAHAPGHDHAAEPRPDDEPIVGARLDRLEIGEDLRGLHETVEDELQPGEPTATRGLVLRSISVEIPRPPQVELQDPDSDQALGGLFRAGVKRPGEGFLEEVHG